MYYSGNKVTKMSINSQLDRYDEQIISILGDDGRLPGTEIAKRIGM